MTCLLVVNFFSLLAFRAMKPNWQPSLSAHRPCIAPSNALSRVQRQQQLFENKNNSISCRTWLKLPNLRCASDIGKETSSRASQFHNPLNCYTKSLGCEETAKVLSNQPQTYFSLNNTGKANADSTSAHSIQHTSRTGLRRRTGIQPAQICQEFQD